MEETLYEKKVAQTYGKLFVAGREYYLLAPLPIEQDSWQYPDQQIWSVIPTERIGVDKGGNEIHSFVRSLVCTNPVVELYPGWKTILVRTEDLMDLAVFLDNPDWDE